MAKKIRSGKLITLSSFDHDRNVSDLEPKKMITMIVNND